MNSFGEYFDKVAVNNIFDKLLQKGYVEYEITNYFILLDWCLKQYNLDYPILDEETLLFFMKLMTTSRNEALIETSKIRKENFFKNNGIF